MDQLTDFARGHDSHVLLVVHMRKREDEGKISGKLDIKGTGALSDMADSVLIAWRNKGKEKEIRKAQQRQEEPPEEMLNKPDAVIVCEKQRNGEDEPMVQLWFDRRSHQFLDGRHSSPRRYVDLDRVPSASGAIESAGAVMHSPDSSHGNSGFRSTPVIGTTASIPSERCRD